MNSGSSNKRRRAAHIFLGACLAVGVLLSIPTPVTTAASPEGEEIMVALDAGHGGLDSGAHGPTGLIEKSVTLELARKLEMQLENEVRVTLTRSDDYQLPLRQRAAIANQAHAGLFVSLHTGAAYLHSIRGMVIYTHQPSLNTTIAAPSAHQSDPALQRWNTIQNRHIAESKRLAEALKGAFIRSGTATECRILSAPLPVLEGTDMPAVLIEVGPITNPAAESNMLSPRGLDTLARAIRQGISAYLDQSTDTR